MNSGTLVVRPLFGAFAHDGDFFGTADPYVVCQIGGQRQQSSVCKDGGKNPRWQDTLQFQVNGDQVMSFQVMDRDHFSSADVLAQGQVNLADVYQRRSINNA